MAARTVSPAATADTVYTAHPAAGYPARDMSDPLALLPLAIAASAGRLDGHDTARLVAAGLTLLQRCAPLVRALTGRRTGILLPPSPAFLVALAASDGRGALLLDRATDATGIARQTRDAGVGALFTVRALASKCPDGLPVVWLDEAPHSACIEVQEVVRTVDLGSHFGLALEGELAAAGRDEECLLAWRPTDAAPTMWTHRALLEQSRRTVVERSLTPVHRTRWMTSPTDVGELLVTCLAPLLAGGDVETG